MFDVSEKRVSMILCARFFVVLYFYISNRAFNGFFLLINRGTPQRKQHLNNEYLTFGGIVGCIINESISDVSVKRNP